MADHGSSEDSHPGTAGQLSWLPLNQRLGRYHLAYELAMGGMGKVYLARAEGAGGFGKLVALKCIHAHLAEEEEFVQMFLDEASIAARITHPNVCSVFDFGAEQGVYYIAMEYLLGETLAMIGRRVAQLQVPPTTRRLAGYYGRIIAQAAEGLHAAHELQGDDGQNLGIVHRDVSPQNLFVSYDGNVQVMDFGIAHAAGRLHVTKSGALKGKLAYMAPEQLDRIELDRRSDVWALGVVLWELLTGRRLFRRKSELDTMVALAKDDIPPPSRMVEGLPAGLDDIVMVALRREREERYATARELSRDLANFVNRLDEPCGVPEVGEWMETLFADERKRRMKLVELARRTGDEPVPRIAGDDEAYDSQVRVSLQKAPPKEVKLEPSIIVETPSTPLIPSDDEAAVPVEIDVSGDEFPDELPGDKTIPMIEAPPGRRPSARAEARRAAAEPTLEMVAIPRKKSRKRLVVGATAAAIVGATAVGWVLASGGGDEPEDSVATASTPDAPQLAAEPTAADEVAEEPEGTPPEEAEPEEAEPETETEPDAPAAPPTMRRERRARAAMTTVRATPPPGAPGTVVVIATGGWADVFAGSRRVGRTPARVTLPAGRHSLRLLPFGREPSVRRTVRVRAGQTTNVAVPLDP